MKKAKHWYDYLWICAILYFTLGFFNILFAWLGMIDFLLPLILAIFGGNKFFCNHLCGRGQLFSKRDGLQVGPLRLFDRYPIDVRQHGVPNLSGGGGGRVHAGGH